ncbi:MAG: methionine adenosyltransferase [Lachnospiraceae bacterium]|nr:methionine adenosyltransferase [Lachnospiraceae bacterium]
MKEILLTSESVTEGHPDKICDQISDAILDAYLTLDSRARVAIEAMVSKNTIMLAGEITSIANVDVVEVTRNVVKRIGYVEENKGFDYKSCLILKNINTQSPDIDRGVSKTANSAGEEVIGGGDQGIMYGYAVNETANYMPLPFDLANKLTMKLTEVRKKGILPWLYPDGKSQVTMKYKENGEPLKITSIVVSAQHHESKDQRSLENEIKSYVINEVIDSQWTDRETKVHINPTGRFVVGGPAGDTGLTGRKIMADTYGTIGKHGGGAFSGKDATKVDRSAAYMARYVAKNVVAAKLADSCEVSLAYVIGGIQPEAIDINTFGTEKVSTEIIKQIILETFSLSVADIIANLDLRRPQFEKTASYGHFGRENEGFRWENLDKVSELREKAFRMI